MIERDHELTMTGLVQAAIDGEGWAFNELYKRYAPRVKAFAASRRVEDPEGVTNDVMLRVFQKIGSFAGDDAGFESWVFTIARNRIIDVHRASTRRVEIVDRDWNDHDEELDVSAEEVALDAIGLDETLLLLDLLTAEQREVIALRMIADLSLDQVATIVERPITAVKALQRRGLARLQKEILRKAVS